MYKFWKRQIGLNFGRFFSKNLSGHPASVLHEGNLINHSSFWRFGMQVTLKKICKWRYSSKQLSRLIPLPDSVSSRETKLADFSNVYFGQYFENYASRPNFLLLLSTVNFMNKFWQKICLATFWTLFSQTHLVTLLCLSVVYSEWMQGPFSETGRNLRPS
jgi:hypothetical protein